MAKPRWLGRALTRLQVDTITVADTWTGTDTVTLTINGKSLILTVGTDDTTDQVAKAIKEMWNGEAQTGTGDHTFSETGNNVAEFKEAVATVAASVVTIKSLSAVGAPFTLAATAVTGGDGDVTKATATTPTGPNWVDNADNWDTGAVPTTGDEAFVDNTDVSLLYGLDQISGNVLASFTAALSFIGTIGLAKTNPAGYAEYRPDFLDLDVTLAKLGNATGTGSGRIKLNFGTVQTALTVIDAGAPLEDGIPAVIVKGTNASNTIEVKRGTVGVALFGGEVSTFLTATVNGGETEFGDGLTLGTVFCGSATVRINSAVTTITQTGGRVDVRNAGTIGTWTITGGVANYNTSGTATAVIVGPGSLDFSGDLSPRTITTLTINRGVGFNDPGKTLTPTNVVIGADLKSFSDPS